MSYQVVEVAAGPGELAQPSRSEKWNYFESLRQGVFCELGAGCVDFPAVLRWLKTGGYRGYVLVEQDILPGMGTPKASAQRSRDYLPSIEASQASFLGRACAGRRSPTSARLRFNQGAVLRGNRAEIQHG